MIYVRSLVDELFSILTFFFFALLHFYYECICSYQLNWLEAKGFLKVTLNVN